MGIILNTEQKAAVEAPEKNILVVAPPGSGKTTVIVERVAHLIEHRRESPYSMLLLTFTRKAAGEMRQRLEKRIGTQAHHLTIGTFHAVALNLLHRFGELIGFRRNATVYGQWETDFLLREIGKDLCIYDGKKWKVKKKDIDATFARYYQEGRIPEQSDPAYGIFKAFSARLKENNSFTYGSLLAGLDLLLPHIAKYLKWNHVIVDESHDNDSLQWHLIWEMQRLLGASVYAIADPRQTIYEWRGSNARYFIENQDKFATYPLLFNYRSGKSIVDAADRLIRHDPDHVDSQMRGVRPEAGRIEIMREMDSAALVHWLTAGKWSKSVAVLCRTHAPLKKLSMLLSEAGADHVYIGRKTELTDSEPFRRFHAFLKLLINEYDNMSVLLAKDLLGLNDTQYKAIRHKAVTEGKSHFQVWIAENAESEWNEDFFIPALSEWNLGSTAAMLHQRLGETYGETAQFVLDWHSANGGDVKEYLSWLATWDIQEEVENNQEGVLQLMSIHAAKGLEFYTVIIAGMNEGIMPSKQAIKNGELSAERRVCFVAATRAEDTLILTVRPEVTETEHRTYHNPESRFVKEMMG